MDMGALVYPVTIKAYTDNTFSNIAIEKKSYFSVALLTNDTFPSTWISDNTSINLLAPYVANINFLGGNFQYKTDGTYSGYVPSRFAPLSIGYYYNTPYVDIVFKNGAYIRQNGYFSTTGNVTFLYSNENVEIGAYSGSDRVNFIGLNENNFYATDFFVCTEITDKKITGSIYRFRYTAAYNSPERWQNRILLSTGTDFTDLINFINNYLPEPLSYDPYSGDGTSETGGGGGMGDYPYDIIDRPTYDSTEEITRGYINRGFVTVFNPTMSELINFRSYVFSSTGTTDLFISIGRMFNSPIESIVSLSMIPYTPTIGDNKETVYLGTLDSGVTSYKVTNQFLTVDWGDLDVPKATRSFNDFSPFTKAEIYLPYIGVRDIDIDKIVGYNITLKYYIDVVSGDFVASLCANGAIDAGTQQYEAMIDAGLQSGVLYQWAGNCALHIPISAANYSAQVAGTLGLIGTIGGSIMGIAAGGAVAPTVAAGIAGGVNAVAQMTKNPVEHSGSIPSTAGWLSVQVPYLILSRPRLSVPENNNQFVGYPTNVFYTLEDVTGYTEIEKIHLENIPATVTEKTEIETLLKTGVIL